MHLDKFGISNGNLAIPSLMHFTHFVEVLNATSYIGANSGCDDEQALTLWKREVLPPGKADLLLVWSLPVLY